MTHNTMIEILKQVDNPTLIRANSTGWLSGFSNILGKELGDWFGTNRWLIQLIVWLIIINIGLGFVLFVVPVLNAPDTVNASNVHSNPEEAYFAGLSLLFNTMAMLGSIGIIVLTQDEIIQEKQSGTAAWILTKPVSRASFILSKLLSNTIGSLVFIILIPASVAYIEIAIASGQSIPLVPYIQALAVMLVTLTFYIAMAIMLGTFFDQRGPILTGTLGILIGGLIVSQFVPTLMHILPLSMDKVALTIVQGQDLSSAMIYELITATLFSFLFIVAALWRFSDEQF